MTTAPAPQPPPSPAGAADAAAFMAELRRLKTWSGLSFRQLDRRAAAAGDTLPYSTASTMLGRDRLPRPELLVAFVKACGVEGDELRVWQTCHAEITAHQAGLSRPPASDAPAVAVPAALPPAALLPTALPPTARRSIRPVTVIAAAALVIASLAGAGLAGGLSDTSDTEVHVLVDSAGGTLH
ncbi:helix-turn-helix domain-containing protein [Nonomuraea fuscirosea]|uniref:helix-turn-helix domain-containing protein n=1 Tax=Nonomuraea fuscirosea TaxID=1291556 RepID=UPI003436CE67